MPRPITDPLAMTLTLLRRARGLTIVEAGARWFPDLAPQSAAAMVSYIEAGNPGRGAVTAEQFRAFAESMGYGADAAERLARAVRRFVGASNRARRPD